MQGVLTRKGFSFLLVLGMSLCASRAHAAYMHGVDLSRAVVLQAPGANAVEDAAVQMLLDETSTRSGISWKTADVHQVSSDIPRIFIGRYEQLQHSPVGSRWSFLRPPPSHTESFRLDFEFGGHGPIVVINGHDDRGVLYGIGYLLRHLEFRSGRISYVGAMHLASFPRYAVRGHQLGYRFKNNTYDAWTPERFEQYIRDLAVFGTNTIEILPPDSDDAPSSPLFPLPAMEMMRRISEITLKYGLRCSVYYPAVAKNYGDPATVESELKAWGEVFRQLPRIDELFVPGGDPGHTDPAILFSFLARVAQVLHRYHPQATVWVSGQGFNAEQLDRFYQMVNARPKWLDGVVAGPQSRDDLISQRARIHKDLPIRFYPDIGHTMHSQFPVQEWDEAYAITEGREVIDPRPADEATIFRHYAPSMSGFITYSEGVNDDVNKFIWTALGWSDKAQINEILQEYARYFVGDSGFKSIDFARGIANLEKNWSGPLLSNKQVSRTLHEFQSMQRAADDRQIHNWRFESALYRAYTDAYEQLRLIDATAQEETALRRLATYSDIGSLAAIHSTEGALSSPSLSSGKVLPLRNQIESLAAHLFSDIGIQLSVTKFGASAVDRGASLDTVDVELNDRAWLEEQLAKIQKLQDEQQRGSALAQLLNWSDAGKGGFYDNLGDPQHEPHLVRGPGYPSDPAFFRSALDGVADRTPNEEWRLSQIAYAGALYDRPLEMKYSGLDRSAQYLVRIEYAGENYTLPISLTANDKYVVHGPHHRSSNPEIVEFPVPRAATREGFLDLKWTRPKGLGGGGRGLQVAEVWLIRLNSTLRKVNKKDAKQSLVGERESGSAKRFQAVDVFSNPFHTIAMLAAGQ